MTFREEMKASKDVQMSEDIAVIKPRVVSVSIVYSSVLSGVVKHWIYTMTRQVNH